MLFHVLGPVEIYGPGETVDLTAEKPRRLLSVLLREANTWVPVDQLIDEIWPADPPVSAAGNVKSYVSHLRKLLPEAPIERRMGAYRLNVARTELDVMIFEDKIGAGLAALAEGAPSTAVAELTEALALWRGQPFASLDSEPTRLVAARLIELRVTARGALAEALIAGGKTDEAIAALQTLATENPLREPIWKSLMEALHAAGRRADALTVYQQARRNLVDQLGVEPGPELQQLHQRLLLDELPPVTPEPPPSAPAGAAPESRRRWPILTPFRVSALALLLVAILVAVAALVWSGSDPGVATGPSSVAPSAPTVARVGGLSPRRAIPGLPAAGSTKLLFGIGEQANLAMASKLVRQAPAHMLTTWYHGRKSLVGLRNWRANLVPGFYQGGYALHLVVADWEEREVVDTKHGVGCGAKYPVSAQFIEDMRELAGIFAGRADGPALYVTMFHGVEAYSCAPGEYARDAAISAYHKALKEQYLLARETFHAEAPNALVSLGWRTWIVGYDEPESGAGLSMVNHFADVLRASDFQSVFALQDKDNVVGVQQAVRKFGEFGPVMLAQYGFNKFTPDLIEKDINALFTDDSIAKLTETGLFAWNFDNESLLESSPATYDVVMDTVRRHGR